MDYVIKDKDRAGKIYSNANYRPIALASVISKLVDVIMLTQLKCIRIQIIISLVSRGNMAQTSVLMFQRKSLTCIENLMAVLCMFPGC